tara:strand:- start:3685 stop:3954 length:270 start_codon:yes stop_codon:yes gene_type:complete
LGYYKIGSCPETTDVELKVRNTGGADAKKIAVIFPDSFRITACENCEIDVLEQGSERIVRAKLCRNLDEEANLEITAVNVPTTSVLLVG